MFRDRAHLLWDVRSSPGMKQPASNYAFDSGATCKIRPFAPIRGWLFRFVHVLYSPDCYDFIQSVETV